MIIHPSQTKHGVKGAEFENVLVVLGKTSLEPIQLEPISRVVS